MHTETELLLENMVREKSLAEGKMSKLKEVAVGLVCLLRDTTECVVRCSLSCAYIDSLFSMM